MNVCGGFSNKKYQHYYIAQCQKRTRVFCIFKFKTKINFLFEAKTNPGEERHEQQSTSAFKFLTPANLHIT